MMTTMTPHLSDGELLLLIDADEGPAEWSSHLAACAQCALQSQRMRDDAALVTQWLERARYEDGTVRALAGARPWTTRLRPLLKAAAVIVLIAAPVAAIPSVRDWLQGRLPSGRESTAPGASVLSAPVPGAGTAIRFVPDGSRLTISFASGQSAGSLRVVRSAGAEAVLDMAADAADGPVVSGTGIIVRNSAASVSGYTLHVPASVTAVSVRVGTAVTVLAADHIDGGMSVPLTPR